MHSPMSLLAYTVHLDVVAYLTIYVVAYLTISLRKAGKITREGIGGKELVGKDVASEI